MITRGASLLVLLGVAGCAGEPVTEIFLSVDTDLVAPAPPFVPIRVIRVEILLPDERLPRTGFTAILNEAYRDHVEPPVTWGIYAESDLDREIEVTVRGFERGAPGELAAIEKRARVQLVPQEIRVLCLDLRGACERGAGGPECDIGETCHVDAAGAAGCVPTEIDEDRLPPYDAADVRCPDGWPAL